MKDKVDSLLVRIAEYSSHRMRSKSPRAADSIRRSLEGIKSEIDVGKPVDPEIVQRIENGMAVLEHNAGITKSVAR